MSVPRRLIILILSLGCAMTFGGVATADQILTKPDGSILVARDLPDPCCTDQTGAGVQQLHPDGSIDEDFGNGGVVFLGTGMGSSVDLLSARDGRAIYVGGAGIIGIDADGTLGPDFDIAAFGSTQISGAALQVDGKVVAVGGNEYEGITVARFKENGELDETFGGDGAFELTIPVSLHGFLAAHAVTVDQMGRIILAGGIPRTVGAVRLLADGMIDTSFGDAGDGATKADVLPTAGSVRVEEVMTEPGGGFRTIGRSMAWLYSYPAFDAGFDANGIPEGSPIELPSHWPAPMAATADGGTALIVGADRFREAPYFLLRKTDEFGLPVFTFDYGIPSEGAALDSVSYDPVTDSLFMTGVIDDLEGCDPGCPNPHLSIMVKSDARTGALDSSFGDGGIASFPVSRCGYEKSDDPPEGEPCRMNAPTVEADVAFKNAAGRKPWLTARVVLADPPVRPYGLARKITVKLPDRLKINSGKIREAGLLKSSSTPDATNVELVGRTIVFEHKPEIPEDRFTLVPNSPIEFNFRLKPGSLKPIPRKLHRKRLWFRVTGTYMPQADAGEVWSPASTGKTVKVRPVNPKRR